jgi:galactose mutarotase-like enzyme
MKRLLPFLLLVPLTTGADFRVSESAGLLTLDNGNGIRAVVAPEHGGELTGFAVEFDGQWQELIYRAMDYSQQPGWRGKAPILWPAVGASVTPAEGKHHYELDGTVYPMPFHGFARDRAWRLIGQEEAAGHAQLTLEMTGTDLFQEKYPFGFNFRVTYCLVAEKLSLEYTVSASADNTRSMPFAIGNHITFRAPLIEGSQAGEQRFRTDLPDLLIRDANGAFAGEVVPSPYDEGWHPISKLPRRNAVSLGGRAGVAELALLDPSGLQLRLVHSASREPAEPAIRFNLWADTEDGFFSPEPWIGTQNALNTGAGIISLEPGETWTWTIDIIPSRATPPGNTTIEDSP